MDKALAIQKEVQRILGTEEVYLVGGSVRDLVMGQEPKDYDFTTSLTPDEMKVKIKKAGRRVYDIGGGIKHGTVTFKVEVADPLITQIDLDEHMFDDFVKRVKPHTEGEPLYGGGYSSFTKKFVFVEVTTHRTEVYDGKSRQPITTFGVSLYEDLARRDFTMNAMVLRSDGTIYDPYGGKLDIHGKQIKTVGMPKDRIQEDPLRMLRAARFAARYGFNIDPNFIGKARQLADRIYDVSIERWVQELDKLLVSEHCGFGIEALIKMNVLQRILPELFGERHDSDENEEITWPLILDRISDNPDLAWKILLCTQKTPQDIKDPSRTIRFVNSGICARLKFSNKRTDIILGKK